MKKNSIKSIFAGSVFGDSVMKKMLNKKHYKEFNSLLCNGGEMSYKLAEKIAIAMKEWATKNGATHYTHWFSPLTGKSAEKQISFVDFSPSGEVLETLSANSLIKGETDASSFPNGGERLTFEARGYTVWDYSSPAFIKEDSNHNKVLYIPTAFCSYNNIALDDKTPLLKAVDALNKAATRLINLAGMKKVKRVFCNVGIEQEYFLIDKQGYLQRKDIILAGRTLFGAKPTCSQELYHHYLGEINDRVSKFMHHLDRELWKVGIMAKIQHNEVAPCQHEIVPVYSTVNIACDQNVLIMEMLDKVAAEHGFKVLLHEKPFNKINGSGKHNNWSLSTDSGQNLLNVNDVPDNIFLLILTSVIAAINRHHKLVRAATATYSNDYRLGGDEAPPSIVSVYVGNYISKIFDSLEKGIKKPSESIQHLNTNILGLPKMEKDNCDRNRTSPFAFTGNKFEFRMVGSSQSNAFVNAVICSIVAQTLNDMSDYIENEKALNLEDKIAFLIKNNIKNHKNIIFNGNGYDKSWHDEARLRGLTNLNNSVDCFKTFTEENTIALFKTLGVLTETELKMRYEICLKNYCENVCLEAETMLNMLNSQVIPSIADSIKYFSNTNLEMLVSLSCDMQKGLNYIYIEKQNLANLIENAESIPIWLDRAVFVKDNIVTKMKDIRNVYDKLEPSIPLRFSSFPNYDQILFKD